MVALIDLENVIELLYLSDMHQAVELKRMCINFTMQYFDIVTKREEFKKLSKTIPKFSQVTVWIKWLSTLKIKRVTVILTRLKSTQVLNKH